MILIEYLLIISYRHLNPGAIKWFVYHGDAKRRSLGFVNYDVILTTYNTIAAEYTVSRDRDQKGSSPLKSFDWHRVVLDEGQHFPSFLDKLQGRAIL